MSRSVSCQACGASAAKLMEALTAGHADRSFTLPTYVHARDVGDAAFLDEALGG